MASLLADSPPAPNGGQAPPENPGGAHTEPAAVPSQAPAAAGACARCGAAMAPGQDWCVQCGAGAPGSLGTPGWRAAATIIGAVAILVLGAAAAAVAALSKGSAKAPVVTKTVAQVIAPSTTTPVTPTSPEGLASTPTTKAPLPSGTVKPPKIPLTAVTPKASEKTATTPSQTNTNTTATSTTPSSTTTTPASTNGETSGEESQQSAILLDTNAASTYNPYGYPASEFGDPSLAIDGDTSTAWTAQVNPENAPKMAEGLLIDLKAKQKVAVLELISSTPGMTVQVYGANGHTAPASITDPAWIPLSAPKVVKKKHLRLALRDADKQFTFITLWISAAPAAAAGSAAAPSHVDVNELELFPPKT
jgi:hypothetical protein